MALLARRRDTGEEIESFDIPAHVWAAMRELPLGTFVVGPDDVPAVLKRSIRGLQFFARSPGSGASTAPESIEHDLAKIALVRGARAAGFTAHVEHSPQGMAWQADVYVERPAGSLAIEVQLSRQHWDEYRTRTERYKAVGTDCIWLVRSSHFSALAKQRIRHWVVNGRSFDEALNLALPDMPLVPLELGPADVSDPMQHMRAVVTGRVVPATGRMPLGDFAAGAARRAMCYENGRWIWN